MESITEMKQPSCSFLWNGKGDEIKRNVIIADYTVGELRMLNMASFNKALKFTWIENIWAKIITENGKFSLTWNPILTERDLPSQAI